MKNFELRPIRLNSEQSLRLIELNADKEALEAELKTVDVEDYVAVEAAFKKVLRFDITRYFWDADLTVLGEGKDMFDEIINSQIDQNT